jgi:signal peptidase II
MSRRVLLPLLLLLSIGLVGCDHATKALALEHLARGKPTVVWPGVIDLRVTLNHDSAFSLWQRLGLQPSVAMLVALMSLALAGLLLLAWRRWRRAGALEQAGFAVALGGAIANLIDRVVRGHVVDFVHVHYWPVFNVADVLLALGLALVIIASLRGPRAMRPDHPTAPGDV